MFENQSVNHAKETDPAALLQPMNLLFKRTFYPVGQGAFYAAEVYQQTPDSYRRLFRAVYDCGSSSAGSPALIGNIIKEEMVDKEVDVLFISHFDQDHIDQVKQLEPKNVIIPYISDEQLKVLEIFSDYFNEKQFDYKAYKGIEGRFPNQPRLIYVRPFDEGHAQNWRNNLDLSEQDGERKVDLASNSLIWATIPGERKKKLMEYVVFSPKLGDFIEQFIEKVNESPLLDYETLNADENGGYITDPENFKELTRIYKELKLKNEHSLVVYSNIVGEAENFCYFKFVSHTALGSRLNPASPKMSLYAEYAKYPTGCVFFGDISVDRKWLNAFYNKLNNSQISQIGALQIPHHGAKSGNGDLILPASNAAFKFPLCFACVGADNRYNHPCYKIIEALRDQGAEVVVINEHPETKLIGIGIINNQI